MLSNELMAAVVLAVFWVHMMLIAASAAMDLRELLRLRARLRRGLWAGTVRRGDGPDGVFARNVVVQIGRGRGDGRIHFSDAAHRSEVFGGAIELDEGQVECAAVEAPVWPDLERRKTAAAAPTNEEIARVEGQARKAKGFERQVVCALAEGDRVFVGAQLHEGRFSDVFMVSANDPRRWLAGRCWLIVGFILAEIGVAVGCTVAASWTPMFGLVSMLGAAAALGVFLGVQPLGVALNEAVRTPDRAYLRGGWSRSRDSPAQL